MCAASGAGCVPTKDGGPKTIYMVVWGDRSIDFACGECIRANPKIKDEANVHEIGRMVNEEFFPSTKPLWRIPRADLAQTVAMLGHASLDALSDEDEDTIVMVPGKPAGCTKEDAKMMYDQLYNRR